MKTAVNVLIAALAFTAIPAKAELFSSAAGGALVGGIAGAIIGNNSGHGNGARGALIGAGAGAIIGALADSDRGHRGSTHVYVGASVGPRYHYRPYGYHYGHHYAYGPRYYPSYHYYSEPTVYYSAPVYRTYSRPSYAASGLVLGGITGAIIGNNSHGHNAWRGAAIGAGAGLLLGAIADNASREREVIVEPAQSYVPAETATSQQPSSSSPQNVTIINNYYNSSNTSMSSANNMFGR